MDEFRNTAVAFCTAITVFEVLCYFEAPRPLVAAAFAFTLAEYAALMYLWAIS